VLTQQIHNYPETVVEHNGNEILELLTFLTGKANLPYRASLDPNVKKLERVQLVFK
jgi:hypothetical protein